MKRVVICGGGFGGVAAARRLRALLPDEDQIVLIDRGTHFAMGFRKTSEIVGRASVEDGSRALADLKRFGIEVVQAEISGIDPATRTVTADGQTYVGDALIVALGAQTVPDAVPGLTEHGIDWYSFDQVARARDAVAALDGGKVAIGIFGVPYKCPPAPFELALLLRESALERKARLQIEVFSPLPSSLPVLGPLGCEAIEGRMLGVGIAFKRATKATSVEAGVVRVEGGEDVSFDLLLAIPPHRVPQVVADAGLTGPSGWVKVDPATLETGIDGVYAVGDIAAMMMANGQPMPKSGAFAEGEGVVVAERIAARFAGREPDARFFGDGACFLETGMGEAMLVRGRFLAEPAPEVELTPPSKAFLEEKATYEASRLDEWFGPR